MRDVCELAVVDLTAARLYPVRKGNGIQPGMPRELGFDEVQDVMKEGGLLVGVGPASGKDNPV